MIRTWWHRTVLGHSVRIRFMTNLPGDTSSNRWAKCECGKDWVG